jgi:hypothetical protein
VGNPKSRSGDQSHDHQAVFNVIACLQCVVPEVECLRDLAAKTDQHKQKGTELKNVSPHFNALKPFQIPHARGDAPPNYTRSLHLKRP